MLLENAARRDTSYFLPIAVIATRCDVSQLAIYEFEIIWGHHHVQFGRQ